MSASRASGGRSRAEPSAPDRLAFASLVLRQPRRGYRFGIEAVLLADFAASLGGRTVIDLGSGCGVLLLLLARFLPDLRRGVGVEIQEELFRFARANISENREEGRLVAVQGDLRRPLPEVGDASFDLVAANPPFRPVGTGRLNPDDVRAIARHELCCTMSDLCGAAARYLAPEGRFATLALPSRLPELLAAAAAAGVVPRVLRFVHPAPGRPAHLVLFAGARRGRAPLVVRPPLFLRAEGARDSFELQGIFRRLHRR